MIAAPLFAALSDDEVLAKTRRLVANERAATAALLQSLMEVDARRLYLREGCSSLFTFCTQVLHLAEGAAYNRIEAARAARRYPALLAALAEGAVTLTSVRLLAPHFTEENHRTLLDAAGHKSKREVEVLVATLRGSQPDSLHPRRGQADGVAARSGTLCVRRNGRPLPGDRVPRVPPRRALCRRWPGDGWEHPAEVSSAQSL